MLVGIFAAKRRKGVRFEELQRRRKEREGEGKRRRTSAGEPFLVVRPLRIEEGAVETEVLDLRVEPGTLRGFLIVPKMSSTSSSRAG